MSSASNKSKMCKKISYIPIFTKLFLTNDNKEKNSIHRWVCKKDYPRYKSSYMCRKNQFHAYPFNYCTELWRPGRARPPSPDNVPPLPPPLPWFSYLYQHWQPIYQTNDIIPLCKLFSCWPSIAVKQNLPSFHPHI